MLPWYFCILNQKNSCYTRLIRKQVEKRKEKHTHWNLTQFHLNSLDHSETLFQADLFAQQIGDSNGFSKNSMCFVSFYFRFVLFSNEFHLPPFSAKMPFHKIFSTPAPFKQWKHLCNRNWHREREQKKKMCKRIGKIQNPCEIEIRSFKLPSRFIWAMIYSYLIYLACIAQFINQVTWTEKRRHQ